MTTLSFATSDASFGARLLPAEARVLYEALSFCSPTDATDAYLRLLLGAGQAVADDLLERLGGRHEEPFDIRFRADELHVLLSALTNAATHFVRADGRFDPEAFHIRLGHFRQEFDALALAINNAAYLAYEAGTSGADPGAA